VANKLRPLLGRLFRYFLWGGVEIAIDGEPLRPIDPLFGKPAKAGMIRAEALAPITFPIRVPTEPTQTSIVTARFTLLPVEILADLSVEQKRDEGIAGGAGVSVVRAEREIAYGWHFMGTKRKENYDDWWRCEVSFSPVLDELFGVTHSKQGIKPSLALGSVLSPTLEGTARQLNRTVRARFMRLRERRPRSTRVASAVETALPPFDSPSVSRRRVGLRRRVVKRAFGLKEYRLMTKPLRHGCFYSCTIEAGILTVTINQNHPFYNTLYVPLLKPGLERERSHLECLLLASARADLQVQTSAYRSVTANRLLGWSNTLAAFLGS
jgi:hypothetical protein